MVEQGSALTEAAAAGWASEWLLLMYLLMACEGLTAVEGPGACRAAIRALFRMDDAMLEQVPLFLEALAAVGAMEDLVRAGAGG